MAIVATRMVVVVTAIVEAPVIAKIDASKVVITINSVGRAAIIIKFAKIGATTAVNFAVIGFARTVVDQAIAVEGSAVGKQPVATATARVIVKLDFAIKIQFDTASLQSIVAIVGQSEELVAAVDLVVVAGLGKRGVVAIIAKLRSLAEIERLVIAIN